MLTAFFLAIALPEFLWSTFPPILSIVAERFGLGPAAASFPIICFAIGTVLFTGIAGRTIDRRGYSASIRIGLSLMTVCAGLRSVDGPFWLLALAQGGVGAAFTFVASSISAYVVDWFEDKWVPLITGVCVNGLWIGLGVSMIVTPLLVNHFGFLGMMRVTAVGAVLIWIAGLALIKPRGPMTRIPVASRSTRGAVLGLFSNRTLRLIFAISFLSGGIYSAVTAALEFIWVGRGFTPADAGLANGLGIFGSIAGGFLLPLLQTRWKSAKWTLVLSQSVTLILCYPLLQASSPSSGTFIAVVLGVFWLGSTPVSLTLLEGAAGSAQAGAASSMFWALNAIGSMGFVWAFTEIMQWVSWRVAAIFSLVLLAGALAAVLAIPSSSNVSSR
jgi:MFS transporter, YNFM family, putative membrane transport protein